MALFKCKMCGGDLDITESVSIAECEYCGAKQTVPKAIDENLQNLYNRANTLRIKSEFDKAEKLYEKIIQADSTQSEAYWGLILCKYGIEYVDDPATFKKVPTCHRASFESIVADEDYKSALENADMSQRIIYEEQAKEIDRIQKDILALAQKEENYDVFICYKETDANGKRTQDSVIANDIYYQLTQEGFKVFYAAITLEGKLGSAYEPIIFAALNSAKVMLVIGTKPEYFNAVWVKNEWSRYLKIIKSDRSKLLIPCYRDMDAYELPEEFAHLQAQDMSKIGFINDVVRGIKKVIVKEEPKPTVVKETVVASGYSNASPLLQRAFMFLEDKDWESAEEYCEKVLDIDPQNAMAYLGKLMAELEVPTQEKLKDQAQPFDDSNNYQKAVRFADDTLRSNLVGYIEFINARNETTRVEGIYNHAKSVMSSANTEEKYAEAAHLFESVKYHRDSSDLMNECYEKAEGCRKDAIYQNAISKANFLSVVSVTHAIKLFQSISGWKDADDQIAQCEAKLPELRKKEENERIERERKAEQERIQCEKEAENKRLAKVKRIKQIKIAAVITAIASIVLIALAFTIVVPSIRYNNAIKAYESGNYENAVELFEKSNNFKDCEKSDIYYKSLYEYGQQLENMSILLAYETYSKLPDGYEDVTQKIAMITPYLKWCNQYCNPVRSSDSNGYGISSKSADIVEIRIFKQNNEYRWAIYCVSEELSSYQPGNKISANGLVTEEGLEPIVEKEYGKFVHNTTLTITYSLSNNGNNLIIKGEWENVKGDDMKDQNTYEKSASK